MPFVNVRNDTQETFHLAFSIVVPMTAENNIAPGATFRRDFASFLPWSIDVRRVDTTQFSPMDSLSHFGTIAGAVAAGTASVLVGSAAVMGSLGGPRGIAPGITAAGALMNQANQGTDSARRGRAFYFY
jgi:hypothetical protein